MPLFQLPAIDGPILGATEGSVLFAGAGETFTQDNANFRYVPADASLILAGTPPADAGKSLLRLGDAISGGTADGTYLGINAPSSFSGRLLDLQADNVRRFSLTALGTLFAHKTSSLTSATDTALTLQMVSTGTPANGFGSLIVWSLQTPSQNRDAGYLAVSWADAADATRKSRMAFSVLSGLTVQEFLRGEAGASGPMIGFLGASAVTRPAATDDLKDALVNLGLYTNGGATPLDLDGGHLEAGRATLTSSDTTTPLITHVQAPNAVQTSRGLEIRIRFDAGTPAGGFGGAVRLRLKSSTTNDRDAAEMEWTWVDATDASRKARLRFRAWDGGSAREGLRIEGGSGVPMLGFLGANAAARQTGGAATAGATYGSTEQTMLQVAYDCLRTFGLLT